MSAPGKLVLRTAVGGLLLGGVLLLTLGHRLDYTGHALAGFGGTLGILAGLLMLRRAPLGREVVGVALVCIALGAVLEGTVFRFAKFDPVDFYNQSLGAALAAACVVDRPTSLPAGRALAGLAVVFLVLGFVFAFA